ncbi:DNA polymerase II [Aeromonas cavernicola]|uniref:DNA polymerase n=1 Tax=Aeromonas cavernicola TaxID=1006623 RepID=A0A2H9U353_9GAMM|nr:DNA polymerase II [Aeromonas cavernicola]PJG58389.1 DNA polymerase II [Aeromonas cavernicola]
MSSSQLPIANSASTAPPTEGFILTRHSRDVRERQRSGGNQGARTEIVMWLWSDQGPVRLVVPGQEPVFFLPDSHMAEAAELFKGAGVSGRFRRLPLHTFDGRAVVGCYFATLSAFHRAIELLLIRGLEHFEADIRLPERYLMERFITAGVRFTGRAVRKGGKPGYWEVNDGRCAPQPLTPRLSWVSLDVECAMDGALFSVGLYSEQDARVIMIGAAEENASRWLTQVEWVADENALFSALEGWFQRHDPDVVMGWNVVNFDFRLLLRRAELVQRRLRLGRGRELCFWRAARHDPQSGNVIIPGRMVLDGIDTLKSATWQFASYSLDAVASELLGRGKDIEDVANRGEKITELFHSDKEALARYNLEDCKLVWEIFEHCHLIPFAIQRASLTGLELDRVGGSVAAFTNLYLPRLHRGGYVAPNLPADGGLASPGGYVMDSKPGLYRHVLVLDFKSLYPSIIRTFCIDPMGLIEGLQQPDRAVPGFRGALFSRDRHFLPDLIATLWAARDAAKAAHDKALSQAIKIIMNSFYGVLGSGGCRFYDPRLASSITLRGHSIMQQTREWIETQGFEVIYGDTDSTFVHLGQEITAVQADEIGHGLATLINEQWAALISREFDLPSYLEIQYETHYRRFLMPTIRGLEKGSKKRYAGLVGTASEGGEQLVFKGLESVRTDWTALAKQFQTRLYELVFHDEDSCGYVRSMVDQTRTGQHDPLLVYRKRLRQKLEEYQKNVPPHVRAARLADEENLRRGLPQRYQHRGTIAYVMTVNGPEPLEYQRSAIDYEHYIEKQLRPIAEAILPFVGESFERICGQQLDLF